MRHLVPGGCPVGGPPVVGGIGPASCEGGLPVVLLCGRGLGLVLGTARHLGVVEGEVHNAS